jgi:hypothetical protein
LITVADIKNDLLFFVLANLINRYKKYYFLYELLKSTGIKNNLLFFLSVDLTSQHHEKNLDPSAHDSKKLKGKTRSRGGGLSGSFLSSPATQKKLLVLILSTSPLSFILLSLPQHPRLSRISSLC